MSLHVSGLTPLSTPPLLGLLPDSGPAPPRDQAQFFLGSARCGAGKGSWLQKPHVPGQGWLGAFRGERAGAWEAEDRHGNGSRGGACQDRTADVWSPALGPALVELPASRPNSNVIRGATKAGQSDPGAPRGPHTPAAGSPHDPAVSPLGHEAQVSQRLQHSRSLAPGDTRPSRMLSPRSPDLFPEGQVPVHSLAPPPLPPLCPS